jgi:hypothetical protein
MPLPNVRTLRELVELFYGIAIIVNPHQTDYTVGTTAVQLGQVANTRINVGLSNWGAAAIAVGFSNSVTATTGIQVPAGGSLFFYGILDVEIVNRDLWAISASAGNAVHVVEYRLSGL